MSMLFGIEVEELFTLPQLAEFIKKKPASIYSDLLRRPESLPPVLRIPGSKKLLFVNPRQWAASLLSVQKVFEKQSKIDTPRRRGAPTKAEQVSRARAGGKNGK